MVSCVDNSGNSSEGDDNHGKGAQEKMEYTFNPRNPAYVKSVLSYSSFKDNSGNIISFQGNSPMTVEMNGKFLSNDVEVVDYGYTDDGGPYGIVSVTGPYGHTSLFITELDNDMGGALRSRIVLFDVNDPGNLFYKQ